MSGFVAIVTPTIADTVLDNPKIHKSHFVLFGADVYCFLSDLIMESITTEEEARVFAVAYSSPISRATVATIIGVFFHCR